MLKRNKNKLHISAGGVVYRQRNQKIEILLLYRRTNKSWHLPKGTLKAGENKQEAAIREVKEETGIITKIQKYIKYLSSIYFLPKGTKINKKTYYYLMKPIGGDFKNHDQEHDKVRWIEINQAKEFLAKSRIFEAENKIINQTIKLLL